MSFENKVVLVTGASSGIGAATALMFCQEGANVAIVGRNEAKLEDVSKRCRDVGRSPLIINADVANDEDVARIISSTIEQYGQLDVLVNSAGIVRYGTLIDGNVLKSYDEVMAVNLRAVVLITMLAAQYLVKTKGNIVNISSIAGQMHTVAACMGYSTSKAGLDHFTRGSALELAGSGVRVNSISPGPVKTDILKNAGLDVEIGQGINTPLGRVSEASEIARLVLYLASEKSRGITGSNFVSDNGCLIGQ